MTRPTSSPTRPTTPGREPRGPWRRLAVVASPCALALLLQAQAAFAQASAPAADLPPGFFRGEVAPLLGERCWPCHGGERIRGGLVMASRDGLLTGGESGPAVDLGDLERSTLLRMVRYEDEDHRMPPDGRLPDADVARLAAWVLAGAPWEGGPLGEPVPEDEAGGPRIPARGDGLEGWGWRAPRRPAVPVAAWRPRGASGVTTSTNPIDAFIAAELSARDLAPAPPADRRTLLRRLSYDLVGLPPSPEQLDAFEADPRADAYERQVERLLAMPEHGQRWARHWLDVVRYAETNGFERDADKPLIWRYRDWVVDALNRDLPYDEFVRLQLAADELPGARVADQVATAYYRLGPWDDEPGEGELVGRYDVFDDIVSTTAQTLLAMNIGCARCHDHPADPIPQADYFRFVGLVHGLTDMSNAGYLADVASDAEREARRVAEAARDAEDLAARQAARAVERTLAARVAADDGQPERAPGLRGLRWAVQPPRPERIATHADPSLVDAQIASAYFARTRQGDQLVASEPVAQGGHLVAGMPAGFRETPRALHGLLAVDPLARREPHVLSARATLDVPADGRYGFRAGAAAGATAGGSTRTRLWLDDELVVDVRDGVAEGVVELAAGRVALRLFVQAEGPAPITLQWGGTPRRPWRYLTSDPEQPDWMAPEADDSWWRPGWPGLGSRDMPGGRVGSEWTSRDLWARTRFRWDGDPASAVLVAHHDEDLQVWIDGELAADLSGYRTDYGVFELSEAARATLTPGEHVLALRCRNTAGAQYAHAAVVPRAMLLGTAPVEAAFGWRSLTADAPWTADPAGELARLDAGRLTDAERAAHAAALQTRRQLGERELPPVRMPMAQETAEVAPMHVHVRGNPRVLGDPVEPGFPGCLDPPPFVAAEVRPGLVSSGRRRALAEWVTDAEHALAARVMVNRVWQHHFGRGLVATPNDFGELGQRPSHLALLDWLTRWFVDEADWSLRALHRLIVTSRTWRQSGRADDATVAADPLNTWLSRFPRRRLGAEELRDSMLALAGVLDTRLGGRPVFEPVSAAVLATSSKPHEVWGHSRPDEIVRRSLYVKSKRSLVPPLHTAFDGAESSVSCPVRFETTAPTQALTLLNGTLVQRVAPQLAARVRAAADDDAGRVAFAHELVWGVVPDPQAVAADVAWLRELRDEHGLDDAAALQDLCLMLVNSNAFVYVD